MHRGAHPGGGFYPLHRRVYLVELGVCPAVGLLCSPETFAAPARPALPVFRTLVDRLQCVHGFVIGPTLKRSKHPCGFGWTAVENGTGPSRLSF
jgi:hypothetical protein